MSWTSRAATVVLAVALWTGCPTRASATTIDFSGQYAVANWNAILDFGFIDLAGAPFSVRLISANAGSFNFEPHDTDFLFSSFEAATIAFDWSFESFDIDGPALDPFGWLLGGAFTQVTSGGFVSCGNLFPPPKPALCNQSGHVAFDVQPGDLFGFRAHSVDGREGPSVTTVSNFSATTGVVPEPATLVLFGTGLVACAWRRRRQTTRHRE